MSGHRVELRVSFTVSDGNGGGRIAAEALVQELEYVGEHYHTGDFELTRGTVDGVDWNEVWPPAPVIPTTAAGMRELFADKDRLVSYFTPESVADGTTKQLLDAYARVYGG